MERTKVLLLEINEITWNLIDPLIAQGKLPTFAFLKKAGTWAAPMSVDLPPQLDPWITWTTVYTGRSQSAHNVYFLEQPPETIKAQRIWEYCHQQGLRVGVFSSICSWPPQPVNGFYVPDTFAPDSQTHPTSLQPIQDLNLTYTRSIRLPNDDDGWAFKLKLGGKLIQLGLKPATITRIARQLAHERVQSEVRWRRVALQPFVNFDFFSRLYRQHQPEFATFHTNHVAHYQHTYWKAMQPELFPQPTTPEEQRVYGNAIEYGYRSADQLLKRVLKLMDRNTVLVVASSMGQKPYITNLKKGKRIRQLKSLGVLLQVLGVIDCARALPTMSDQFNIYPESEAAANFIEDALRVAYVDEPTRPMFYVERVADALTITLRSFDEITEDSNCHFPHVDRILRYGDLVHHTGMVKSGCHDPKGILLLYGRGIQTGAHIAECNNLDIAPTLLSLLDLPIPAVMEGRVLHEAFQEGSEVWYDAIPRLAKAG